MKIRDALNILRKCDEKERGCLVAFSGGKDSITTLSLCRRAFENVEAFYMYMVPGLECIEGPIRRICQKLDVQLRMVPHWHLSEILKKGVYSPKLRANTIKNLKQRDIEAFLKAKSGLSWCAYGHRMSDSVSRRYYLRKRGIVDLDRMRLAPIYDWKTSEVIRYLELNGLNYNMPTFGSDKDRGHGFTLKKDCITWLKDNYPDDYGRVLEFFPAVGALEFRTKWG